MNKEEKKYFELYSFCWLFKVEKLFWSFTILRNFSTMNIREFGRILTPELTTPLVWNIFFLFIEKKIPTYNHPWHCCHSAVTINNTFCSPLEFSVLPEHCGAHKYPTSWWIAHTSLGRSFPPRQQNKTLRSQYFDERQVSGQHCPYLLAKLESYQM